MTHLFRAGGPTGEEEGERRAGPGATGSQHVHCCGPALCGSLDQGLPVGVESKRVLLPAVGGSGE